MQANWDRNNPLNPVLTGLFGPTSPHLYVWHNTSDVYGFSEGARALIATARGKGMTVFEYSNTGNHCLMDPTIEMNIANFLR